MEGEAFLASILNRAQAGVIVAVARFVIISEAGEMADAQLHGVNRLRVRRSGELLLLLLLLEADLRLDIDGRNE